MEQTTTTKNNSKFLYYYISGRKDNIAWSASGTAAPQFIENLHTRIAKKKATKTNKKKTKRWNYSSDKKVNYCNVVGRHYSFKYLLNTLSEGSLHLI